MRPLFSASCLGFLSTTPAAAADAPEAPVPFTITTSAGRFAFGEFPSPPPRLLSADARLCMVGISWDGARLVPRDEGCPDVIASEVLFTVQDWKVDGPEVETHLGEVWFVYPTDHAGQPRMLVRQSPDAQLTLPASVDAIPFTIRAWSFLRYPTEAHHDGAPDVSCLVHVETDLRGYTTAVEVEGCEAPFRDATAAAVRLWRFEPMVVDSVPMGTALTLRTTFVAASPEREVAAAPSEQSQRLWAERQFDAMSREDRLWFIRSTLLDPEEHDLGPGQVRVTLPPAPELGEREVSETIRAVRPPPKELPAHDPILHIASVNGGEIELYELFLPEVPRDQEASCPVLVQVDGERQVFSWAEEGCDPELRMFSVESAELWLMRHDSEQDSSHRARFRATFRYAPGGVELLLPADTVRTPVDALPEHVHTTLAARAVRRVPPRLPRNQPLPDAACLLDVDVSKRGMPERITVAECPAEVAAIATKAVRRWRWQPAEFDGEPVPEKTQVQIRFQP